jgi:hypothetical protein
MFSHNVLNRTHSLKRIYAFKERQFKWLQIKQVDEHCNVGITQRIPSMAASVCRIYNKIDKYLDATPHLFWQHFLTLEYLVFFSFLLHGRALALFALYKYANLRSSYL